MEHNKVQKIPFGAFSKAKAMVSFAQTATSILALLKHGVGKNPPSK